LKYCQLIQQHQLAAECRVSGDNSAVEFHKLRHGIWQNLLRKNGGPTHEQMSTTILHLTEQLLLVLLATAVDAGV